MRRGSYFQHGRQRHRAKGSDPIYDGDPIIFDTDNEGGYLLVVANDATGDIPGVGDGGIGFVDKTGQGAYLVSIDGDGVYSAVSAFPGSIQLQANVGGASPVGVVIDSGAVQIGIGGATLFQLDADGTLHLKAGASVVTDL